MPIDPQFTEWTSGGQPYSIETWRNTNEVEADWLARHQEAVTFWQRPENHPPD